MLSPFRHGFAILLMVFSIAQSLHAQSADPKLDGVNAFREKWQVERATEAIDALCLKYPKKIEYLLRRAQLMADFGEFQEAAEDCRDLLGSKLSPEQSFSVNYLYSIVLICQDQMDEAKEFIAEAFPLTSDDYNLLTLGGNFQYLMGDNVTALEYYNKCIDMSPGNPDALYWKGAVLLALGKEAESKPFFRKNIEVESRAGIVYLSCYSYLHLGEPDKAVRLIEEKGPEMGLENYRGNLPSILCMAGKTAESMEALSVFWEFRDFSLYHYLKLTHDLDCLRSLPEFQKLFGEIFPD